MLEGGLQFLAFISAVDAFQRLATALLVYTIYLHHLEPLFVCICHDSSECYLDSGCESLCPSRNRDLRSPPVYASVIRCKFACTTCNRRLASCSNKAMESQNRIAGLNLGHDARQTIPHLHGQLISCCRRVTSDSHGGVGNSLQEKARWWNLQ